MYYHHYYEKITINYKKTHNYIDFDHEIIIFYYVNY